MFTHPPRTHPLTTRLQTLVAGTLAAVALTGCGMPVAATLAAPTLRQQSPAAAAVSLAPRLPASTGRRAVTMLSYVMMDDPLSVFGQRYLNAVEASTQPNTYQLALADFLGPANTNLYYLQADRDTQRVTSPTSPLSPGTTELAVNDPAVLAATVGWAYGSYPGSFQAMTVQAHGFGYRGLGTDATQPNGRRTMLSLAEFGGALRSGLAGDRLNLINMLSCLMGNIEYAYELRDVAEVMIASESAIAASDETTVQVTGELNRLLGSGKPDARAVAGRITEFATAAGRKHSYSAISAIDLTRIQAVADAVTALTQGLQAEWPMQEKAILAAYDAVPVIVSDSTSGQRDLWAFCESLKRAPDAGIRTRAQTVQDTLGRALLNTRNRIGLGTNGLGICLPTRADFARPEMAATIAAGRSTRFAVDTGWGTFLTRLETAIRQDGIPNRFPTATRS